MGCIRKNVGSPIFYPKHCGSLIIIWKYYINYVYDYQFIKAATFEIIDSNMLCRIMCVFCLNGETIEGFSDGNFIFFHFNYNFPVYSTTYEITCFHKVINYLCDCYVAEIKPLQALTSSFLSVCPSLLSKSRTILIFNP